MSGNWTPGPWVVFTPEGYGGPNTLPGLGIEATNGTAIVWYADCPETGIQYDRDAHLIAAAPELAEALEEARSWLVMYVGLEEDHETMRQVDAALRKARGEAA